MCSVCVCVCASYAIIHRCRIILLRYNHTNCKSDFESHTQHTFQPNHSCHSNCYRNGFSFTAFEEPPFLFNSSNDFEISSLAPNKFRVSVSLNIILVHTRQAITRFSLFLVMRFLRRNARIEYLKLQPIPIQIRNYWISFFYQCWIIWEIVQALPHRKPRNSFTRVNWTLFFLNEIPNSNVLTIINRFRSFSCYIFSTFWFFGLFFLLLLGQISQRINKSRNGKREWNW